MFAPTLMRVDAGHGLVSKDRRQRRSGCHAPAGPAEALEPRLLLAFFTVTNTDDAGPGSLRQAMLDAAANPDPDAIAFQVPEGSTFRPRSPLPEITSPLVFQASPYAPQFNIDGRDAGPAANGLVVAATASGTYVRGLAIYGFGASGIVTSAPDQPNGGLILQGCVIGVETATDISQRNGRDTAGSAGIKVLPGGNAYIGSDIGIMNPQPGAGRVVVAGTIGNGVQITGGTATFRDAHVQDNTATGITVTGEGSQINITGPDEVFRFWPVSTVTGNYDGGVALGAGSRASRLQAVTITGNSGSGVDIIDSPYNQVRFCNISGNSFGGVKLNGENADRNVLVGNNMSDNLAFGLALGGGASDNTIGGARANPSSPSPANLINSNGEPGDLRSRATGVFIRGAGTKDNQFINNQINDNTEDGVDISDGASSNIFATVGNLDRATIAGNGSGVVMHGDSTRYNAFYNVSIYGNGRLPVDLVRTGAYDGLNPNDPLDADVGPNGLLNHPVIRSVAPQADGSVVVTGSIDTTPATIVTIHLYADTLPPSGTFGGGGPQARFPLGTVGVMTDAAGHADFTATGVYRPDLLSGQAAPLPVGSYVTAAASVDQPGVESLNRPRMPADFSEFAPPVRVPGPAQVAAVFVNASGWNGVFRLNLEDAGLGSRQYGVALTGEYTAGQNPRPLPWINLDEISVRFTEDVGVEDDDLRVVGQRVGPYGFADFHYDPATFTATWRLDRRLPVDRIALDLDSTPAGVTARDDGTALDGDADGSPGGDFRSRFAALPGDADRNGRVNAIDLAEVRYRQNKPERYSPFVDVNGDGRINALDMAAVKQRLNTRLPDSAAPTPTALLFSDERVL